MPCQVTVDTNFAPATGGKGGSVKAEYKHDTMCLNADMDLGLTTINASAVAGHKGWLAGYSTSFDLGKSTITKVKTGLNPLKKSLPTSRKVYQVWFNKCLSGRIGLAFYSTYFDLGKSTLTQVRIGLNPLKTSLPTLLKVYQVWFNKFLGGRILLAFYSTYFDLGKSTITK
jgi:hypothetical protein